MPRKVKIILNPMADMHNAWRVANDLRPVINDYGGADWSGTVYPTHATALAKQAELRGKKLENLDPQLRTILEGASGFAPEPVESQSTMLLLQHAPESLVHPGRIGNYHSAVINRVLYH